MVFWSFKVFKAKKAKLLGIKAALLGKIAKGDKMLKIGLITIKHHSYNVFGSFKVFKAKKTKLFAVKAPLLGRKLKTLKLQNTM